jgi:hypothetical protein
MNREEMLTAMMVHNLRDYAHQCWEEGDMEQYDMLHSLATKVEEGNATDEEFKEAIYQCTL